MKKKLWLFDSLEEFVPKMCVFFEMLLVRIISSRHVVHCIHATGVDWRAHTMLIFLVFDSHPRGSRNDSFRQSASQRRRTSAHVNASSQQMTRKIKQRKLCGINLQWRWERECERERASTITSLPPDQSNTRRKAHSTSTTDRTRSDKYTGKYHKRTFSNKSQISFFSQ